MLTIQRQFSLPNCILILEGLNPDSTETPRPLLSTLTRFECHFGNESQVIQGGRELLNLLAQRVHTQAQALLSGINSKPVQTTNQGLTLQPEGQGNFRLTITEELLQSSEPEQANQNTTDHNTTGLELKLNSVQLFDLVEAFDQLMEDTQTLPDLSLKLSPLSRKEAQSQGVAGQKFIPVGLGIASLAVIAAISFVIPAPEITKPTAPATEETTESLIETQPSSDGKPPTDGTSDDTSQETQPSSSEKPLETTTNETSSVIEVKPEGE